ncbi:MAG: CapA family protein [Chloroflexi bacterium]|nr:CapA family protein [Chloroflexota bacterium]
MMRRLAPCLAPLLFVLLLAAACASSAGAPEAPPPSDTPATTAITAAATPTQATASATPLPVTPTPLVASTRVPPPAGASITISAAGDISLARQVAVRMEASGGAYPFALMAGLMTGDIGFANLEGALTDRGEPWPKGYNFRSPPRFAPWLFAAHFDIVTLANNHTLDYGGTGLLDTLAALDAAGVRHIGAGADAVAAHAPVIAEAHGLRVAFLGYVATPDEGGGFSIRAWEAGATTPGVAVGSAEAIAAGVAAAKRVADFVIVAVHAGDEYRTAPNATQRALAQAALDAGADAYIGAHAHVVQPIEMRGGQIIAWGLGNFIFDLDQVDLANIPVPRVSLILKLTLTKGAGVTAWQAIPVTQDAAEDRPRPATADEAAALRQIIGPDWP